MDFYASIRQILENYDSSIKTFMYPNARYEENTGHFEVFPVCVINSNISGSGNTEANGDIRDTVNYSVRFMTNDVRDNFDAENYSGISENSYKKALDMQKLGNSVLNMFKQTNLFKEKPTWSYNLLFKETSNVLTGCIFNISFSVAADFECLK